MAKQLEWKGRGSGSTTNTSESFRPKSNFIITMRGTPAANTTYTVQMTPDNATAWRDASGTGNPITASNFGQFNCPYGYVFRVQRTGTGDQTTDLFFEYGELTTLPFLNAS